MRLTLIYLVILIFLIGFYFVVPTKMDTTIMTAMIVAILFTLLIFIFRKEKVPELKGQFLKHSTIFLIGFFIVHFQYYIDFLLGNIDRNNFYIWINTNIVLKSFVLSFVGLISFFLGYLNYKKLRNNKNILFEPIYLKTGVLTFLAVIALLIYFLTANKLYLIGFYGAENMGVEATYAILSFSVLVFAIIIQNCRNMIILNKVPNNLKQYVKQQGIPLTSIILIYLLSVMVSGDRGPLITIGSLYLSGYYFVTKKKLNWKIGTLFIIIGAGFITLLGIARSLDKNLDFDTKISESLSVKTRYKDQSFLPPTQELAGSVRALHTTINYIPEQHDFFYGRFQFQQLVVIVPFFSIFTPLIFDETSTKFNGSASFITWINQGNFPTYGEGSTCIADFYFDFGIIGVIVGMFIAGYVIRLAELSMYQKELPNFFVNSFFIVYFSYALYIARSSFLFSFRTVVWVFIILIINKYLINKR